MEDMFKLGKNRWHVVKEKWWGMVTVSEDECKKDFWKETYRLILNAPFPLINTSICELAYFHFGTEQKGGGM